MAQEVVGFRFLPTGEELINFYLKNKILNKPWLVQDAINEINICNYDPDILPYLSKIQSKDPEWYFFSPIEYTTSKKTAIKRTTPSGFWKATGNDRKIKDKRGHGVEIGIKKTLVYRLGRVPNDVSTHWVIHEYHITRLPLLKDLPQSQRSYVICQVMYKGEDADKFLVDSSNGPSHSLVSEPNSARAINNALEVEQPVQEDLYGFSLHDFLVGELSPSDGFNPDTLLEESNNQYNPVVVQPLQGDLPVPMPEQGELSPGDGFNPDTFLDEPDYLELPPQTPYNDEYYNGLMSYNNGNYKEAFHCPEIMMYTNLNKHGPKQPVSGYIDESGSDDETLSGMSYQGPSSSGDSSGSSSRYFPSSSSTDSCKDLQTSADPSTYGKNRKTQFTPSPQEMKNVESRAVDASTDKELPSMVKTESWFVTEEAVERNRKNPRYIYLVNMIIGLFLLLALNSNILSVLASVKT